MKHVYSTFKIMLALCLVTVKLSAQLSGVYTINSALATSGTTFQTFSALAASLTTAGVSGPVTINVAPGSGPYNEQVNFTQATGISATNTITINGNGCTLTYSATNVNLKHTLMLSGADYMTFNNLKVIGTSTVYAFTCHLWNGANNNTFNNCLFDAPLVGTVVGLCPFSASGSSITVASAGNCGNDNVVNTCTMTGGYYSTVFYGASAAPFNTGNKVLNSVIRDFYTYGFYNLYCQGTTAKGNVLDRLNRTGVTTTYAMYLSTGSTANELIEGNHIRNLFNGIVGSTSIAYCIYTTADATAGNQNIIRNNVISDINSSGTIYGIYVSGGAYTDVYHNTLSLDDPSSGAAATLNTYGIYSSGPNNNIKNNLVTISRGGLSDKYCLFLTTAATNLQCDYNDFYLTSTTGAVGVAYLGAAFVTLNDWQLGYPAYDQNSRAVNPVYTNSTALNYVPTSTAINNMCLSVGVINDITGFARDLSTPDVGAYEFYTQLCSGVPAANAVVTPTMVLCPGSTLNLVFANSFTNTGYTFQWQSSTLSVGGFAPIPGATVAVYGTPPVNVTTYYNAVITCSVSSGFVTATAGQVQIMPATINNVPYLEDFEGISKPNQLPNCSWAASNVGGSTLTYTNSGTGLRVPHSGAKFASFMNAPVGTNYFYSNGINMFPGITYSASLWYITETVGVNNWTSLTIKTGTTQTPAGLTTIASVAPVAPNLYQPLGGTFTVPASGLYYMVVEAVSASGVSTYLTWDDLQVIIPCSLNGPNLGITSNSTTLCSGQVLNLTATGADTYSWNTGATTNTLSDTPAFPTTYEVVGTNTLSGCSTTLSQNIVVNPSPQVIISANTTVICTGETASLNAQGAGTYTYSWAHGPNGPQTNVSPLSTTVYSVIALNSAGCTQMAVTAVVVHPLPAVTATRSATDLCQGEPVDLTGGGAQTYLWTSDQVNFQAGSPITVIPPSSGVYTVTGTDVNGCTNTAFVVVGVNECTGLHEAGPQAKANIYPNPTNGALVITVGNAIEKTIDVCDVTGRLVYTTTNAEQSTHIDIGGLAAGVYYVKVVSGNSYNVTKLIKE